MSLHGRLCRLHPTHSGQSTVWYDPTNSTRDDWINFWYRSMANQTVYISNSKNAHLYSFGVLSVCFSRTKPWG
jgi:hypothetical protein